MTKHLNLMFEVSPFSPMQLRSRQSPLADCSVNDYAGRSGVIPQAVVLSDD